MRPTLRRAATALTATLALLLAGCGGAGYGDPIAAGDGGGTTALAPAPVTTPGDAAAGGGTPGTATTGGAPAAGGGGATGGSGGNAPDADDDDDAGGGSNGGGGADDGASDGDDGGAAASVAAYASDANRFCTGFKAATRSLATEIAAAGSDTAGVGRAIVRYGENIQSAATGLRAAPVPSVATTYHQRTLRWVSGVSSAIRSRRGGLQNGQASAGASVIREVQGLGQPPLGSQVPSSLRGRATACAA